MWPPDPPDPPEPFEIDDSLREALQSIENEAIRILRIIDARRKDRIWAQKKWNRIHIRKLQWQEDGF